MSGEADCRSPERRGMAEVGRGGGGGGAGGEGVHAYEVRKSSKECASSHDA